MINRRFVIIDCKNHQHTAYINRTRIVTACPEGIITCLEALNEFRTDPIGFVHKYQLKTVQRFILRRG